MNGRVTLWAPHLAQIYAGEARPGVTLGGPLEFNGVDLLTAEVTGLQV